MPVDHVLRFEHLREDFAALMNECNVAFEEPLPRFQKTSSVSHKFGMNDFEPGTLQMINDAYKEDFALGDYKMVAPNSWTVHVERNRW